MKDFDTFLNKFLDNLFVGKVFKVKNKERKLKAAIHLVTVSYVDKDGDYYKALFDDGSFLLIIPSDKEIYYTDKLIDKIEEIADEDIGKKEFLIFQGKEYKLGYKDEYQVVLQLLAGSPLDIEGECSFSDYFPTSGPKEYLSLGWLSRTGQRADIWCELIDIDEVEVG